jgi:hypothetical protein
MTSAHLPLSMRKAHLSRLLARRPDGIFVAPFAFAMPTSVPACKLGNDLGQIGTMVLISAKPADALRTDSTHRRRVWLGLGRQPAAADPDLGQGSAGPFEAAKAKLPRGLGVLPCHADTSRIRIITKTLLQRGLTAHDRLQFVWSIQAVFRRSGMWPAIGEVRESFGHWAIEWHKGRPIAMMRCAIELDLSKIFKGSYLPKRSFQQILYLRVGS